MVPVKEIPPRSRSRVLTLPGARSRASSPATARTGPLACSGARRRPAPKSLPSRCPAPDAPGGTFTQWLIYRMPPGITSLAAVPPGAAEGVNDFGRRGYGGPCPPRGAAHHYRFVVLALDTWLGLAAGARRSDLDSRVSGHVLGRGELVATYRRA